MRGSIDPTWISFEDFEKDLQHAVAHPEAQPLHLDGTLTLFGDTIAEMSEWDCFKPKARGNDKSERGPLTSLGMPHRDPSRKIGRNDPCPEASRTVKGAIAQRIAPTEYIKLAEYPKFAPRGGLAEQIRLLAPRFVG